MKRAYVKIPEGQMHYRFEGNGEPIILLHMAVASSDEFSRAMHFLSRRYRAIALDFMGTGDSDQAPRQYDVMDHARTVISFMDALGIKRANIVGQLLGGHIGAEIAINWPQRVHKLVMAGPGYFEEDEASTLKKPVNFTTTVELQKDGLHLLEWWRRACLWGDYPVEILEERLMEYVKAGPRGEEAHWAGAAYNLKPRLALIPCPTLVLDATYYLFHRQAQEVKNLIPDSELTTIKDGTMYVDRAMPEEFAMAILDFLDAPKA
jgi:pimeloyl-ACP methyl ester carboxylesterase